MTLDGGARLAKLSLEVGAGAALTLSALGVPLGWPFVGRMYIHQYDPKAFFDAAGTWLKIADDVGEARRRIGELVGGVSGKGWRSEDGRAFQHRMDRYLGDLASIHIRARVTAAVLYVVAAALLAMVMFQWLVATAMAAIAAWVLLAAVTPISLVGARVLAHNVLADMYAVYQMVESGVDTVLHVAAGALGVTIAGDILVEAIDGGFSTVGDLAAGTLAQGPLLVWGSANRFERDLTAQGLGGEMPLRAGFAQAAGAKAVNDVASGRQTVTGRYVPEQDDDGSYAFPWE
ncbi:hypothetical protein ABT294_08925 [Nonomuraea sp. NPDC000554]|uniref:hypothetical protein n=1 Tax=Nonomuraea sp. NPDC000554 TaxID=3154259 RepID=UPI00331C7316